MWCLEPLGSLEPPPSSLSQPIIHPPGDSASCASLSSGIPTVPGKVTLQKDAQNLIGISIGGGAQYCPCLYIVQVVGVLGVRGEVLVGRAPPYLGMTKAGSFLCFVELVLTLNS